MKIKELCDVIETSVQKRRTSKYSHSKKSNPWIEVPEIILNDCMSYFTQRIVSESKKHPDRFPISRAMMKALIKEYDTKIKNILIRVGYPENESISFQRFLFYKVVIGTSIFICDEPISDIFYENNIAYKMYSNFQHVIALIEANIFLTQNAFEILLLDDHLVDNMDREEFKSIADERLRIIKELANVSEKLNISKHLTAIETAHEFVTNQYDYIKAQREDSGGSK